MRTIQLPNWHQPMHLNRYARLTRISHSSKTYGRAYREVYSTAKMPTVYEVLRWISQYNTGA